MRILLTNDDGLRAPGIAAMYESLVDHHGFFGKPLADLVLPVAPLTVQSATSHGVTFHEPLMIKEEFLTGSGPDDRIAGVAIDGRPADCVKLAIANIWPERFGPGSRPDLVISGMNAGANVGINVIYSGTVAAALEAAFLGIPSIAVSLHMGKSRPLFEVAARHARHTIEAILRHGIPSPHTCLSINIPITEADAPLPPIRACPMNTHGHNDSYERRVSPAGDVYYWSTAHGLDFRITDNGSDVQELFKRHITVTPLYHDLTHRAVLEDWTRKVGPES
jgi:5'-nucleotidase